jgi:hypothetical protein
MEDVVGNYPHVNACIQSKVSKSGGIMSGRSSRWGGSVTYILDYNTYPAQRFSLIGPLEHLVIPNVPSDNWAASEVQGATNPSEPSVAIPVAIGELKDIPKMLQRKVKAEGGNSTLDSQFGWGPMVDDVLKLFNVVDSVEKRLKVLKQLGRGKPMSRRRTVFSGTLSSSDTTRKITDSHPRGSLWTNLDHKTTRLTKQATIRWAPTFNISELDPNELRKLALRQVLGLDPQHIGKSLYELMPWTWFIDYFSNLGDLVSTSQNSVASPTGLAAVSTVTTTTLNVSGYEFSEPGVSCSPFRMIRRDWVRNPIFPVLEFRLPILTAGQTTTLVNLISNWK